jgi:hypothetical protein
VPIAEQLAGEVLGLFQEPYRLSIKARVFSVKHRKLERCCLLILNDQFQGKKLPWGRQLMPTKFISVARKVSESDRNLPFMFILRVRVCPEDGSIHMMSAESTSEAPSKKAIGSSYRMYVLPLLTLQGRLCEVYVIAEIASPDAFHQTTTRRPKSPTVRRRPKTPGLCGGVIEMPVEQDELETAPAAVRELVDHEYEMLLQRLTHAAEARATHP